MTSRPSVSRRDSGVRVDGLREALLALNRFDKAVGKEARDLIREETKKIQMKARQVDSGSPAEARSKAWIGRRVNSSGAGILLRADRFPRALSTEFGSYTHPVYGRLRPQRYMKRETFEKWSGNALDTTGRTGPGYVILPTIRRMLPQSVEDVSRGLFEILQRELDRAGVPRG